MVAFAREQSRLPARWSHLRARNRVCPQDGRICARAIAFARKMVAFARATTPTVSDCLRRQCLCWETVPQPQKRKPLKNKALQRNLWVEKACSVRAKLEQACGN